MRRSGGDVQGLPAVLAAALSRPQDMLTATATEVPWERPDHSASNPVRCRGRGPRLSGSEVTFDADAVTLGMMAGSHELADVRRDPRVELHSAPLEDGLATGDAKLTGHLAELDGGVPGQPGAGRFELLLTGVSLVQVQGDELVFLTWAPGRGQRERRRR